MERIAIETAALKNAAETLEDLLRGVQTDLEEMYGAVQELGSMGEGPAHDAFLVQFSEDRQRAQSLCDALRQFIQSMTFAGTSYDHCEKTICELIDSIGI